MFQWHQGNCAGVSSNAKSELPGTVLHKEGLLTKEQYQTYLREVQKPKASQWSIAARLAGLSSEQVAERKRQVLIHILSHVVSVPAAQVQFQPRPDAPPAPVLLSGMALLFAVTSHISREKILEFCPDFLPASTIRVPEKVLPSLETLPLEAEERGLLKVVPNNPTIAEVFEASFLEEARIASGLLAFWLAGLVLIESEEASRQKAHEESLSENESFRKRATS
jgi:hypothetical protein